MVNLYLEGCHKIEFFFRRHIVCNTECIIYRIHLDMSTVSLV